MTKYIFIIISLFFLTVSCKKESSRPRAAVALAKCAAGMPVGVDTAIQTALAAHPDTAGVVVAIYHPNYGYIQKAYGLEHRALARAMTTNHLFDIGSVMKNFRWVVMHKLANAGSLNLTDNVNTHVASPVLPGRTIKHLMHHSSGMIDIPESNFIADVSANPTSTYSYNDMMTFLSGSSGAGYTSGLTDVFNVGVDHRYSSFGPLIASEAALAVTGKGMRQLIDEMILTPLGLDQTTFISFESKPANVAQGYDDAVTEMNAMSDYADTQGYSSGFGGLMYSSACDLARYTNNQFNNASFLSAATVNAMTTDFISSGAVDIGLGVFRYGLWGNFWGHLGSSIHGHSSAIAHRTADKLSIVVLANIDDAHDNYATQFAIISAIGAEL